MRPSLVASVVIGLKSRGKGGVGGRRCGQNKGTNKKRKEKENSVILQTPKPKGYALDLQRKSLSAEMAQLVECPAKMPSTC